MQMKLNKIARTLRRQFARLWLHGRSREIAVAVVLTVAAVGFMTLAIYRGNGGVDRPTHTAIRKAS
jgi:hypothetical protein